MSGKLEPRSIFVLRNNDVGDVLAATPLLEALRNHFPRARLTAGVGPWAMPVLTFNPHVDEVLPVAAPWFNKYARHRNPVGRLAYLLMSPQVRRVRARRFDLGIDVLGSRWGGLLLRFAGIGVRLGVAGYDTGAGSFDLSIPFDPSEHVAKTALRLGEFLGAPPGAELRPKLFLSPEELRQGEAAWRNSSAATLRPRIVLAPGAGLQVKSWPLVRYRELTERLARETSCAIAVSGGPQDRAAGEDLAATSLAVADRTGQSLREAFSLVATCDYVICNSSMVLHVAAAFGKPALTLLGPAFSSAKAHQSVWGYPGLTWSLGREEPARSEIASVEEAMNTMRQLGWLAR